MILLLYFFFIWEGQELNEVYVNSHSILNMFEKNPFMGKHFCLEFSRLLFLVVSQI